MTTAGTQFRFKVTVDGIDIGSFTSLDGLSAEYTVMPYSEGGENRFEHQLPGPLKYSTIKLTRASVPGIGTGQLVLEVQREVEPRVRDEDRGDHRDRPRRRGPRQLGSLRRLPVQVDGAFVRRRRETPSSRRPSSSVTTGS